MDQTDWCVKRAWRVFPSVAAEPATDFRIEGGGEPTVVLLSGLGDDLRTWDPIVDRLSGDCTMFRYSRPGYGRSSPVRHGKGGRDGEFVATHLKTCLETVGPMPPYVMVGHSMGGLYALCFARLFRELVSGLVLIDPRAPGFSTECKRSGLSSEPHWCLKLMLPYHVRAEIRGATAAERQAIIPDRLEEIPVAPLSISTRPKGFSPPLFDAWRQAQREFVDKLPRRRLIVVDDCGHYIHQEQPGLVSKAIIELCDRLRVER